MKKLAMLLAVLMLAVAAFSVSAFEDVSVNDACFDAVNTLSSLEIIKGKTETTFAPNDPVTREQMAMLFTRLYTTINFENGENMTPFTDLDDPYFNSAIAWCYDAKVINGTSLTTFEPKGGIIYQDALTMACRLLGYTDLTYPLGFITKARLVGLTDGLDGVAYDKELTRAEVAIILYNALEAEGAEIIRENKVKWYTDTGSGNSYPIQESVERNFEIAIDVYNFKKETYQIVGTENFNLKGYSAASETSYTLVRVDEDGVRFGDATTKEFEELGLAEDTDGDAGILANLDIIYRGDDLDDKKVIILSAVINSDVDHDAELGIYFKKAKNSDKMEAQKDKILVDGKTYDLNKNKMVYTVDNNGEIDVVTDISTIPVFWQEKEDEQGKYAQKIVDADKDDVPDYIMIFPMTFEKVKKISNKGVYVLGASGSFDTEDEDCKLIINAEVEKDDYVLTYQYGKFTVIDSVVEPIVTSVKSYTGSNGNYKYTLATGDVVTFAKANNPVKDADGYEAVIDIEKEQSFYVINDKIVLKDGANAAGYDAYTYAFFVNKGDEETVVDTEDAAIYKVYNLIAFIGGKARNIPVEKEYADKFTDGNQCMMTITDVKDGKYIVDKDIQIVKAYDPSSEVGKEGFEIVLSGADIKYDANTKLYKITDTSGSGKTYIIDLTADTELFTEIRKNGKYETIKTYTMANFPQLNTRLDKAVLSVVKDAENNAVSYNLLVAYIADGQNMGDNDAYTTFRIVLTEGKTGDGKGGELTTYEVLNPVTGTIETITASENSDKMVAGDIVREQTSGKVVKVSDAKAVFAGQSDLSNGDYTKHLMQINTVINDALATVYDGKNKGALGASYKTQEILLSDVNVVVIDIDDKTGEFVVDTTEDYADLEGKVVRTYVTESLGYKPAYMVIVPEEWADAAGFTDLTAYED